LEIFYEELENAWIQNSTETLNTQLEEKYLMLRKSAKRDSDKLRNIQDNHRKRLEEQYQKEVVQLGDAEEEFRREEGEFRERRENVGTTISQIGRRI